MKKVDTTNIQEAGERTTLPAGAYVCVIKNVEDVPEKEYLKITYDIASGEYAGYYDTIRANHPEWAWVGAYVKSYKTAALPMFKRFCSAVSKSNGAFVFDGNQVNADEKTLIGKKLGIVLREEEYYSNSGDKRTRLIVHSECPIERLATQKVPDPKKLPEEEKNDFITIPENEEIPF